MPRDLQKESPTALGQVGFGREGLADPAESARMALLVRAAQVGERAAVDALIAALSPLVLRVVRSLLGPEQPNIENVVRDALLAVIDVLPSWRPEATLLPLAARMAARRAAAAEPRRSGLAGWVERLSGGPRTRSGPPVGDTPSVEASGNGSVAGRRRQILRKLLGELPEPQVEVMVLRLILGYSAAEIAVISGVPENAVKSRLRLAKEELRRRAEADPSWAEIWGAET